MDVRLEPVFGAHDQAILHRIDPAIAQMRREVGFVADMVLPIPILPESALAVRDVASPPCTHVGPCTVIRSGLRHQSVPASSGKSMMWSLCITAGPEGDHADAGCPTRKRQDNGGWCGSGRASCLDARYLPRLRDVAPWFSQGNRIAIQVSIQAFCQSCIIRVWARDISAEIWPRAAPVVRFAADSHALIHGLVILSLLPRGRGSILVRPPRFLRAASAAARTPHLTPPHRTATVPRTTGDPT